MNIDTTHINKRDTVVLMPCGLDKQGRYATRPEPAEAATDVGHDDDPFNAARGTIIGAALGLAAWLAAIGLAVRLLA